MTPNRARKTDTAKLLAQENIPHREAAYRSSNRQLRLPDGTIHDFATGPLRYLGLAGSGQGSVVSMTVSEATTTKSWAVTTAYSGPTLRRALDDERSGLILLHVAQDMGTAPDRLVGEIEAGAHRDRNIIIFREPKHGEHRKDPATGRNIFLRAEAPEHRAVPTFNNVALAKARIAFALRYADMLATGADPATALGAVAPDMDRFGTPEALAIATAARSVITPLRSGSNLAHELSAREELFGSHVVEVAGSAALSGRLVAGLRDAAATLEADLRIGLIG